ncbi:hypothetical protein BT63DRAFT_423675 [Microthyrium microscopicum]|uniref:Uncharacterized protein n=1 Tax=Microthyrium microscopicum TaxID=703497 RepID=A0A6A6UJ18_9PEZI|nr:hypothetical protein BT63DRAFT_423675 [Microthyrium microscopicum]
MLIFNSLAATCQITFTYVYFTFRTKHWKEIWTLDTGLILLSIWSLWIWTDCLVRELAQTVTASYMLADSILSIFKVLSDVFMLWGIWRLIGRYRYMDIDAPTFLPGTIIAFIMLFLGLYQWIELLSLSLTWLSFSDLKAIASIANARSAFDVTFTAVEFCWTTIAMIYVSSDYKSYIGSAENQHDEYYITYMARCLFVIPLLCIRSFCEVVIVGQINRNPVNLTQIYRAREVTYQLFSVAFTIMVRLLIPPRQKEEDPLAQKHREALEEMRNRIGTQMQSTTAQGNKTAPSLEEFFKIPALLGQKNSIDNTPKFTRKTMKKELERLQLLYKGWVPVYRYEEQDAPTEDDISVII